jgi:large subunit ribosomal protein L28e
MSTDLTWMLIRNNSAFLVKRGGLQFSREAGNLMNRNSQKYTGLATTKPVTLQAAPASAKGVQVRLTKKAVPAAKVAKHTRTITLAKGFRSSAKSVRSLLGKAYRPDLATVAVARLRAICDSQKPVKLRAVKKARGSAARK